MTRRKVATLALLTAFVVAVPLVYLLRVPAVPTLPALLPSLRPPLPAWTASGQKLDDGRAIRFETTLLMIERELGDPAIPPAPYLRNLSGSALSSLLRTYSGTRRVDIMTAPSVLAEEGEVANLRIGSATIWSQTRGGTTETEEVGITTFLRAVNNGTGGFELQSHTVVSEEMGMHETDSGFQVPIFQRWECGSPVTLPQGESILFGGNVQTTTQEIRDLWLGLPFLERKRTSKLSRELIVIITPKEDGE